jgi:hypothetical protein
VRVSVGLAQVTDENVQEALRMHDEVEKRCKNVDAWQYGMAAGEIPPARGIAAVSQGRSTVAWQAR